MRGDLVHLVVSYSDDDGDAVGFGFRGVNGSGWGQETHAFDAPFYGRASPGQISYPFNHACTQAPSRESDIEFWIVDSGDRRDSVTVNLTCS